MVLLSLGPLSFPRPLLSDNSPDDCSLPVSKFRPSMSNSAYPIHLPRWEDRPIFLHRQDRIFTGLRFLVT